MRMAAPFCLGRGDGANPNPPPPSTHTRCQSSDPPCTAPPPPRPMRFRHFRFSNTQAHVGSFFSTPKPTLDPNFTRHHPPQSFQAPVPPLQGPHHTFSTDTPHSPPGKEGCARTCRGGPISRCRGTGDCRLRLPRATPNNMIWNPHFVIWTPFTLLGHWAMKHPHPPMQPDPPPRNDPRTPPPPASNNPPAPFQTPPPATHFPPAPPPPPTRTPPALNCQPPPPGPPEGGGVESPSLEPPRHTKCHLQPPSQQPPRPPNLAARGR